jgi:hypothetical protein
MDGNLVLRKGGLAKRAIEMRLLRLQGNESLGRG